MENEQSDIEVSATEVETQMPSSPNIRKNIVKNLRFPAMV